MINWIKNLFTSSPAPVAEPLVLTDPIKEEVRVTKVKVTKKAATKTASKKPAAIKAEPAKRGRKPKNEAGA